jgi:hypothetical protein
MFQVGDLVVPDETTMGPSMYRVWTDYLDEVEAPYLVVNKVAGNIVWLDMPYGSSDYRAAFFRHYAATPVALASIYVIRQLKAG